MRGGVRQPPDVEHGAPAVIPGIEVPAHDRGFFGVDKYCAFFGLFRYQVIARALTACPVHHGSLRSAEKRHRTGTSDAAGVDHRMLGEEGELADGEVSHRVSGRQVLPRPQCGVGNRGVVLNLVN